MLINLKNVEKSLQNQQFGNGVFVESLIVTNWHGSYAAQISIFVWQLQYYNSLFIINCQLISHKSVTIRILLKNLKI